MPMNRSAKKKRQQRAQSQQAHALLRQQQQEQHQRTAAQRAEKQWNKTLAQTNKATAGGTTHELGGAARALDDRKYLRRSWESLVMKSPVLGLELGECCKKNDTHHFDECHCSKTSFNE